MDDGELAQPLAEIARRCAQLPAEARERALDAFAQVLTLVELPRERIESTALSVTFARARPAPPIRAVDRGRRALDST